jgi:hypothetical protein
MKSRDKTKNPHEAALKYLPTNSSINCPFDRSDKDEPEEKRGKLN